MDPKKKSISNKKPAVTIVFESWSIPIVGLVMFLIGTFSGYNFQLKDNPSNTLAVIATQLPQNPPVSISNSSEEVMEFLLTQARHFQGNPDAPVTLIEFGDFQ